MALKEFRVTLWLRVDDEVHDEPDRWDWPELLDLPYEDVSVAEYIDVTPEKED